MVRELSEDLRRSARRLAPDELWDKVQAKFAELKRRPGFFARMARSMGERLRKVIDAGRYPTKY